MSREDRTMANLRQFVMAQYRTAPRETQLLAHQFFDAMDTDRNGSVDYREFKYFLVSEGLGYYAGRNVFMKLDGDRNRGLDFWEIMTLYYIIRSGRPFCFGCDIFLWDAFYVCNVCNGGPYNYCNNCYQHHQQSQHRFRNQVYTHTHNDGYMMQRSQTTSNAMVTHSNTAAGNYLRSASSPAGMVPTSRSTSVRQGNNSTLRTAFRAFEIAVGVGQLAVGVASCSIM